MNPIPIPAGERCRAAVNRAQVTGGFEEPVATSVTVPAGLRGARAAARACRCLALLALLCFSVSSSPAQWLSQTITLKPGWNAIYLHVDASHQSLDTLIPDANSPVAEVWLWRPKLSTIQFIDSPNNPTGADSRWAVWTSARGDVDTLQTMVGNGAYLVRNRTAGNFVLTLKGKPVPPAYQWTTTGLNFIGFPTPGSSAPTFATFLNPVPELDLAKAFQNSARVFRYPGNEANGASPSPREVLGLPGDTTVVTRGEAFWVRGSTNYFNHYYGPVEVSLQNSAGINYRDSLGSYSLRLKNRTSTSRTVALTPLNSESAPAGQPAITARPQLLVRGALSPTTLSHAHTVLTTHTVTLTPEGEVGSEQEVVLGLDRSSMTGAPGAFYAGIVRVTDSGGLQRIDLPVSATVPDASGLWVGQATVDRVGQYLKQYPKVTDTNNPAALATALAQAGQVADGAQVPGSNWVARATPTGRYYKAVASSLDGRRAVAAVDAGPGRLFVTSDYGVTWIERESTADRAYKAVACSADGSVMVAAAANGNIYVSSNAGTSWVARESVRSWIGIACSADGRRMAAVVQGGFVYVSSNGGITWTSKDTVRNWSSIAMSQDGTKLVAGVNPGSLFTSTDSGETWIGRQGDQFRKWYAVASSADGSRLIAGIDNEQQTGGVGGVYISSDSGTNWQVVAALEARRWHAVASSIDGKRLGAVSYQGGTQYIQLSDDRGVTWTGQSPPVSSLAIAMSGDGTRVIALGYASTIFTLQRTFADFELDPATGLIRDQTGRYVSSGVNTSMAKVPSPVPLRLILHNNATASQVSLLQRVYVGKGANTANTVVANREQWLDATQIASARRISATHLPFTLTNTFWSVAGNFAPGSVVTLTVPLEYNDHTSNPFLHTFHPDHDNLDPNFKNVLPQGTESYALTRQLKLAFSSGGADFRSLTASAQGRSGTYEETITLGGKAGATREFRLTGTFSLQRISPISTLTTQ